jgi:hypothetical protein
MAEKYKAKMPERDEFNIIETAAPIIGTQKAIDLYWYVGETFHGGFELDHYDAERLDDEAADMAQLYYLQSRFLSDIFQCLFELSQEEPVTHKGIWDDFQLCLSEDMSDG